MKIIVEGCDAVGKDSFIQNTVRLTRIPVTRGSSFEISESGADAMFEHAKSILNKRGTILVNRSFYSNIVYGKMFDYPMMSEEQYAKLNNIANEKAIVYYLTADTEVIAERMRKRGDNMIEPSDIDAIKKSYELMWLKYKPVNLIVIDVTNEDLLDINSPIYSKVINHGVNMEYINETYSEEE